MTDKIVYRRSNRAEKAIQNGIFMAVSGFVFGTAFGVLIGIKYNIGGKDSENSSGTVSSPDNRAETDASASAGEPGLFSDVRTGTGAVGSGINDFQEMVQPGNPLRGMWTAKYSQVSVALSFTENFECEIYQPGISGGLSNRNWKRLDTIPYTLRVHEESPRWQSITGSNSAFRWSDVSALTTYEFTNRDGSIVDGEKDHQFRLMAKYEGRDSPQDTDDYIVFELELIGNFFEVGDNAILTSLPASKKWERRVEVNFRQNSNPLL